MKTIKLPCYGIVVELDDKGGGTIRSDLRDFGEDEDGFVANSMLSGASDALETIILAHACAGVDIEAPAYLEGIEVAVDKIFNEFA